MGEENNIDNIHKVLVTPPCLEGNRRGCSEDDHDNYKEEFDHDDDKDSINNNDPPDARDSPPDARESCISC
jgi:hypothetical protein